MKYKIVLIISPLILILDQLTKMIIRSKFALGEYIAVIPGYFDIVHVANKGAAFGMMATFNPAFRKPFFYIVSAIALIIIIALIIKLPKKDKFSALIFSLILSGILGNLIDRIRFGQVTDFLSFHIQNKIADFTLFGHYFNFRLEWPAFNVADSAITIAMILLVISLFMPSSSEKTNK